MKKMKKKIFKNFDNFTHSKFDKKNDFFYENAYLILESSFLMDNHYFALERTKDLSDRQETSESKKPYQPSSSTITKMDNYSACSSYPTIPTNQSIETIGSDKSPSSQKTNKSDVLFKSRLTNKTSSYKSEKTEFSKSNNSNSKINTSNSYQPLKLNNRSSYMNISDPFLPSISNNTMSPKLLDSSLITKSSKKLEKEFSLSLGIEEKSISRKNNKMKDVSNSNEYLIGDLTKHRFKYFLKSEAMKGKNLDYNSIMTFIHENPDKFLEDRYSSTYQLKTRNLPYETRRDDVIHSLETLDSLKQTLPNFKSQILEMKKNNINLEKMKILLDFESKSINNKLDSLLSENKTKLNWDKIDLKQIEYQKSKIANDICGHKQETTNPICKQYFPKLPKTKYKKFGSQLKMMVVPKRIKESEKIYDDQKVVQLSQIKKDVTKLVDLKKIDLKSKKYLDKMAKAKSPRVNKLTDLLQNKCEKILDKNLVLMNKIIKSKREYNKESLYMNTKAAYVTPK